MSDLIYREDAIKAINARSNWYQVTCNGKQIAVMLMAKDVNEMLEKVPSADRPQGEWVKVKNDGVWSYAEAYAECDQCHKVIFNGWKMNFCPNCGCRMKGADDETRNETV